MSEPWQELDLELQIKDLFIGSRAVYAPQDGTYKIDGPVEHVIDGWLTRFVLMPSQGVDFPREVSLFHGVDDLAGELWEHEVRNLLRLRMLGHPALPEIVDGRWDRTNHVAFIMTRKIGRPLAEEDWGDVHTWVGDQPVVAFEQFGLLVDALSQLHGTRIVHRNLTLGAIRWAKDPKRPARAALALTRFELSALVKNLLHNVRGPDDAHARAVRDLFLTPPPNVSRARHLAYLAPETYPSVFGEVRVRRLDHGTTDVFGLGVLGWELFLGAVTDLLPDECARVETSPQEGLPEALAALHAAMRRRLSGTTGVPRRLRDVLVDMLDPSPSGRISSFDAAAALQRHWTDISLSLGPEKPTERPRLLAFMPERSIQTVHVDRGWTDHSPDTPEGCRELQTFLEDELRQAQLVHSATGAQGFVHGDSPQSLAEAQWVLIGTQAVWFCAFHYDEAISGRRKEVHADTLMIKYVLDKRYADDVLATWPRRSIGRFDLVPFRLDQSLTSEREGRPSWEDLTQAVVTDRVVEHQASQRLLQSYRFMLEYQGIALRARQYPYVRAQSAEGDMVVLTHDHDRDRRWIHGDPLLASYADARRRPALGDFARQLLAEHPRAKITVVDDRTTKDGNPVDPHFGRGPVTVRLEKRLDADSVLVVVPAGRWLPERGWLRFDQDRGTEIQLRREVRGLDSLTHKPGLIRILDSPSSIELRNRGGTSRDQRELRGKGASIISNMLRFHPFYALQGPPGTGKSTVVSKALRDFLETEHGARVLVSAQSNDALDQLAEKIVKELEQRIDDRSVLALRELSRSREAGDELRDSLKKFTTDQIVQDLVAHIGRRVAKGCQGANDEDEQRLMKRWADLARDNMVELTERVKSGADIVFATCSTAGALSDEIRDPSDIFDWVIIEEAAKAWPTEIVMPLVRGVRWTLVGDYRQLGPHRARDVETFLEGLASHEHNQIKTHYANRHRYLDHLQMFRRFFEGHDPAQSASALRPVDVLDTQFRMHPDIAQPFARTFYSIADGEDVAGLSGSTPGTFLKPDPYIEQIHGRVDPPYLENAPLVWLDTSRHDGCGDRPYWANDGEAAVIEELVAQLGLADRTDPGELVVVTPYRKQVQILEGKGLKGRAHTVHSFQGGEAQTVIVSLVRSGDRGEGARENIGHTAQPEVINVMLSRARQLLVVVGDLPHFEQYGGQDWRTVIQVFREVGVIVDAVTEEVVGGRNRALPTPRRAGDGEPSQSLSEDSR